jgi:hypothetical protein
LPEYWYLPIQNVKRGCLLGQATKNSKGFVNFVDDGVFLFTNKNDLIQGAGLIKALLQVLG